MKTNILILTALIAGIMLLVMPAIYAEDNVTDSSAAIALYDDTSNVSEGLVISPAPVTTTADDLNESESVGGWKLGWKQFGIWMTWSAEKRAEKELELARLQLIRAKIAAKHNNTAAMEKAMEAHEKIMNRVQSQVEKIKAKNMSDDRFVGLDRAIQVHEDRITKINEILSNENLTDDQRVKIEDRLAHLENVTSKLNALKEKKTELKETKQEYKDIKEEAKARNMTIKEVAVERTNERVEKLKIEHAAELKARNRSGNSENESS